MLNSKTLSNLIDFASFENGVEVAIIMTSIAEIWRIGEAL